MLLKVIFRLGSSIIGIAIFCAIYFGELYPSNITNFGDLLASTISLGSIAVGFLSAAITLMPAFGDSSLVRKLKEMGAYKKLLSYIISALSWLFLISIYSLTMLLVNFEVENNITLIMFGIWSAILIIAILKTVIVIVSFTKYLLILSDD